MLIFHTDMAAPSDGEAKAAVARSLAQKEKNCRLKPEDRLMALKGDAKAEVAAMGSMSDEEVVQWFNHSDMMKRVIQKTGPSLQDILNGASQLKKSS